MKLNRPSIAARMTPVAKAAPTRVLVVVEVASARRFDSLPFSLGVRIVKVEERLAIHNRCRQSIPSDVQEIVNLPQEELPKTHDALALVVAKLGPERAPDSYGTCPAKSWAWLSTWAGPENVYFRSLRIRSCSVG